MMKKTYILILELEAEIREILCTRNKKKDKYFNKLLEEFLKNDKVVRDIFRIWLMADLGSDNHIYEVDKNMSILRDNDELECIRSIIKSLPVDAQKHFQDVFDRDKESIDRYFEILFDHLGSMKLKRGDFLEKRE
ncbi:MAG: hypothetical protein L0Y73_00135 [Candidatus Aminicenantes bacterium]|nr:hypothetical protein [Candidatus Aminicenantes bacterium]